MSEKIQVQRIRDPLHDLIEFSTSKSELERVLWDVVQTRPFQRLRRVKQLGFSEMIYPGASHTRFAHSLGVFHTARHLMGVVKRDKATNEESKEVRALAAALVHDLGHGPFSHAFEDVGKRLSLKFADHEEMSNVLIREGEVASELNKMGSGFASDVADIIRKDGVKSVQHAVVSSQFDADRLDYIRRDRMMSGTQHAAIDFNWLINNLRVASVPVGVDDKQTGSIETFVLDSKASFAAEAYVLGLFQLYPTIYFHKATRGIEKLYTEIIVRIVELVREGDWKKVGLPIGHPLIIFAKSPDKIEAALNLDDTVFWGSLSILANSKDSLIAEFSKRIRDRKIFSWVDIRAQVAHKLDPETLNTDEMIEKIDRCCAEIAAKIYDLNSTVVNKVNHVLVDKAERSPYKSVSESKGPLDRINIFTAGGNLVDLKERSPVVASLKKFKLFRAYYSRENGDAEKLITDIVEGVTQDA